MKPSDAYSQADNKISIRGIVITSKGVPLEGVEVQCWYMNENDFPFEYKRQASNNHGRYEFHVPSGRKYFVQAGGKKATVAISQTFTANPGKDISVEDLITLPADGNLKGRILKSDGSPASGMLYACRSKSFMPFSNSYPKTDPNGGFHILNVLRNEEISLWIVPSQTKVQIWTGILPGRDDLLLRIDPEKFLELPPDWNKYGYISGLVRGMGRTKVQDKVNFNIADLEGNEISSDSDRFKGKVVLVNIFGSWCGSCNGEIPHLVNFKKKYKSQDLEIIGIAFERDSEEIARIKIRRLIKKHKINYPVLFGGQEKRTHVLSTIKGIDSFSGYPTTIFIGRDGKVKDVKVNFLSETPEITKWQVKQFEKIIVPLLKEPVEN
jgi:thiol-disulfide isomerase/thioredoxin